MMTATRHPYLDVMSHKRRGNLVGLPLACRADSNAPFSNVNHRGEKYRKEIGFVPYAANPLVGLAFPPASW